MAKNFWIRYPAKTRMNGTTKNLIEECKRQEESSLYMSTTLYEWMKWLRCRRILFVILPIVFGGLAVKPLLLPQPDYQWVTGFFGLLAGIMPAIYKALDMDMSLDELGKSAHQFKVLQDRFRQAWRVTALGDLNEFKAEFTSLMDRMDAARRDSLTAPERFFKKAQKKIIKGHYDFSVDGST